MSDDIIQELKMDLEREKEKIFFQKYKYPIIIISTLILLGIGGYQYYQKQKNDSFKKAADDYYNFTQFYNNIENLNDIIAKTPQLLSQTLVDVPNYLPMSSLIIFNNAQKQDATEAELLKITNDYLNNPIEKPLSVHDSILKLFNLSLKSNSMDFKTIEPEFAEYLKHPFAFKAVSYEMLLLLALDAGDGDKARAYLIELQKYSDKQNTSKIRIYQTHPLLVQQLVKDKPAVIQKTNPSIK